MMKYVMMMISREEQGWDMTLRIMDAGLMVISLFNSGSLRSSVQYHYAAVVFTKLLMSFHRFPLSYPSWP